MVSIIIIIPFTIRSNDKRPNASQGDRRHGNKENYTLVYNKHNIRGSAHNTMKLLG